MHQILTNKLDSIKIIIGVCFKEKSIIICHPPLFKLPIAPPYYQQRPRQTCFKRRGGGVKKALGRPYITGSSIQSPGHPPAYSRPARLSVSTRRAGRGSSSSGWTKYIRQSGDCVCTNVCTKSAAVR